MRNEVAPAFGEIEQRAGTSRLLSRLYREIGINAVAAELNVELPLADDDESAPASVARTALEGPSGAELAA
jgi:hypothetical protein